MDFSVFLYRDDILWITAFTLGGLTFALGPILIVHLFLPRKTRQIGNNTDQFIECGMDPIGDSWIPLEYENKSSMVTAKNLNFEGEHNVIFKVKDKCGNVKTWEKVMTFD